MIRNKYIPEPFVAPENAEALGQPMLVFAEMAQDTPLKPILDANGLSHIDPNQWYPMQNALNVFKAVYEDPNGPPSDLVAIGMKAMETFSLPTEVNTIEAIMPFFDQIAKAFSRGVPDGFGMPVEITEQGRGLLYNYTPIPFSAVYGFIYSILNTYKPSDQLVLVKVLTDESESPTVFEITWEHIEDGLIG